MFFMSVSLMFPLCTAVAISSAAFSVFSILKLVVGAFCFAEIYASSLHVVSFRIFSSNFSLFL